MGRVGGGTCLLPLEASLQSFASLLKAEKADARLGVKWGTRTIGSAEQIP